MCDNPVPCACTIEKRREAVLDHIERQDALRSMWSRLRDAGQLSEAEDALLIRKVEEEWDDAIHIASPDDPMRSLCGQYGRNLADLPERPDGGSGCWTCLQKADELAPQSNLCEFTSPRRRPCGPAVATVTMPMRAPKPYRRACRDHAERLESIGQPVKWDAACVVCGHEGKSQHDEPNGIDVFWLCDEHEAECDEVGREGQFVTHEETLRGI